MSKTNNRQYRVIRGYNNRYGLEALVRRIVRHHINGVDSLDKMQSQTGHKLQEK